MAFPGFLLFPLLFQTLSGLEVFAPSPQRVLNGSSVVLPCSFSINKLPLDPKYLAILWSFKGRQILVYDNKGIKKDPKATFDGEATKDGNASLTLDKVTLSDDGTYSCLVVYSPDQIQKDIVLEVQVRPMVIPHNKPVRKESENTLLCEASGFFPPDIEISWTLDGKIQNNSFLGEPVENKDGTYNVTSSVTFTPTPEAKTLSCTVHHASLHQPLQEDLLLVYEDSSAGVIAACFIIAFILIIAISGALWWNRKQRKKDCGPLLVRDVKGPPKLIDGEEAVLYCTVDNAPEDLCVTWLIRRAGEEQEIQTSQMRGRSEEEEESLLDTSYVIKSQRDGRQYSSSLSFIPHMERHKDTTFICRGASGQHKDERTFYCRTILVKPKMSKPIIRSLFVSKEIKYLLNLEKCYPKNITFIWMCGAEMTEVVSSTDSVSENPDRTYNVSSEVVIPEDRHKDPGFRVRVTWEHASMEEPESRELSMRDSDYRWTPVVEDIQVPRLLLGSPAVLQCNISGYFPDAVTVKWMRRDGDKLYEEADDNQRITSRRAADNTYSRTASLTITPDRGTHQGAEYICVVEHSSLETPIERSTGRLRVWGKPQMSAPIHITMEDSSRVQFSLNLEKFYPKDIKISWHWENTDGKCPLSPTMETVSTRDNNVTYEVSSVVQIPGHQFTDPEMEIIVVWKHESMRMPETRSLSVRDLPWRPHIGSIRVPELEKGKEATLTCDISGYFPDLLSVTWFTKKSGNITALSRDSSNVDRKYKMSQKEKREKDHTYSCEASVTFTPISSDQGSEIICRVEHPSEERLIERSTGPLHIGERKQNTKQEKGSVSKLMAETVSKIPLPGTKIIEAAVEADESTGAETQEETKQPS
ncbi:uncharacterized protein LOC142246484 [Anomaloglossus baeobatrachus]|uniref:uncharacterized protein LOC142246484 n=1 Tax=Anomaloglossus baeobatrachus TaxID=238106 RepID=UPI003F5091E2